jgi:hypothetical protein
MCHPASACRGRRPTPVRLLPSPPPSSLSTLVTNLSTSVASTSGVGAWCSQSILFNNTMGWPNISAFLTLSTREQKAPKVAVLTISRS